MTTLPQKLTGNSNLVAILADELELGNHSYSFKNNTSPHNMILIANEIRVTGTSIFDVGGNPSVVFLSSSRTKQFKLPKHPRGEFLEWCLTNGQNCGRPVALAYCQSKGFPLVKTFLKINDFGKEGKTMRTFKGNQLCTGWWCDAFKSITCQTKRRPKMKNTINAQGGTIAILARRLICDGGKLELFAVGGEFLFMQQSESEKVRCNVIPMNSCRVLRVEVGGHR